MSDRSEQVWRAVGTLVSRALAGRKAVTVPRFGTFTFTSAPVDLDGVTNPSARERDAREAVFTLASDFAPNIRVGISHSTGIRPYTARGFSGKVPTITLNYTELSQIAQLDKESCKKTLDQSIRELSDAAKAGTDIRKTIPNLGTFVVKNGIAAVIFDDNVLRPAPGPGHLTPDGEEWLKTNLDIDMTPNKKPKSRPLSASLRSDPAKTAVSFKPLLSSPVDFLLENQARVLLLFQMRDQGNTGVLSFEDVAQCVRVLENQSLTEDLMRQLVDLTSTKSGNKVRYRDLIAGLKRFKTPRAQTTGTGARSDFTDNYNRASIVPLARKIWDAKVSLAELAQKGGMRPRIKTTASELLSLLKKSELNVNIHQLRAFLREDGLEPTSVSVLDLINAARTILKPEAGDLSVFSEILSQKSVRPQTPRDSDKLQDFFQAHPLTEVFFTAKNDGEIVTLNAFLDAVQTLGKGTVKALEAQREFLRASKGRNELSAREFYEAFQMQESGKQVEERCLRTLRQWLRDEKLSSEQGFNDFLLRAGAADKLSRQQFLSVLSSFPLSPSDIEVLFDALDTKRDQFLDLSEWLNKIYETEGPYQSLRDVLLKANIPKEDLIVHLGLLGKDSLSDQQLVAVLQRMDQGLTPQQAMNIAVTVLRGRSVLPVAELLSQITKDTHEVKGDWVEQVYQRIRKRLTNQPQRLKAVFEGADLKHVGRLPVVEFQDCLFKAGLGLDAVDIQRLAKILDQSDTRSIDYYRFLEKLNGPEANSKDPFRVTVERLQSFLRQNGVTPEVLLAKMGGAVPILTFAHFLSSKVYQRLPPAEISEIASKMDLNGDGLIDAADVNAVLNARSRVSLEGQSSLPNEVLSADKARSVLTEVRNALIHKKISYVDAFKKLDTEGTGMVSFPNFMAGMDRMVQLSEPVKEGLFRLFDKQGIGMIDYQTFLRIVRDSDFEQKSARDNWDWEQDVINRIRTWASTEKLSIEAVFRAFDRDFDGVLSKKDLQESLQSILKLDDLPSSKVDRLYKLLDAFKRDSVQLADFKVLFEENRRPDWRVSAKQQIGLAVSRGFPSLMEAFEQISEMTGKVTFAQFKQFIESKDVLSGFNLTHPLLQELFADIDTKRKGFISDLDWTNAFGNYQHKQLSFQELKDTLRANFADMESAFDFFLSFHLTQPPGKLLMSEFEAAIESLIPKRFSKPDIRSLWQSIARERGYIDFKDFSAAFSDLRFMSTFSSRRSASRPSTERASARSASTSRLSALSEDDPFRRLHNLLKSSPKPLEEIFKEMDADLSGKISAIEFRNAIRSLNLGLTAREIDQLLFRVDTNADGQIDWVEFSRKFQPSESEARIKTVTQQRLNKLRNYMFAYMLSPRDAFRQFDSARTGRLEFAAFNSLVRKLYELSGEPVPAFSVLKDLFDVVDNRKDGYLDIKEWLSVFKQSSEGQSWEDTKAFQDLARTIGKNRKMLLLTFEAMSRDGKVPYQSAKDVLSTVLKEANLTEEQWKQVVRPAEREGMVDFKQLLDVYKERASARDMHPRA